jgi:hypothetical protein
MERARVRVNVRYLQGRKMILRAVYAASGQVARATIPTNDEQTGSPPWDKIDEREKNVHLPSAANPMHDWSLRQPFQS